MKDKREIAQWVIDNRYSKGENNKVSDSEMYNHLIEMLDGRDSSLIEYMYEFAWQYGRFYHIGDADKIIEAVGERIQLPEEFLNNK